MTENNLEMLYDTSTIEKSQDIRLQLSFWDKLARFSSMISWEESPFSSLAPSRSSKSAAVPVARAKCKLRIKRNLNNKGFIDREHPFLILHPGRF